MDSTIEESKKRITYPQDWIAYNKAQTQEKILFLELLYELTQHDEFNISLIEKLAHKHKLGKSYPIVLRTLTFDGYIYSRQEKSETFYCFTSPILRNWWRKYVIDIHNP